MSSPSTQIPSETDAEPNAPGAIEIVPVEEPSPEPLAAPPASSWQTLKSSRWRPVAAFGGALLIGGLLMPFVTGSTRNVQAPVAATSSWEMALPLGATMVLQPSTAPGRAMNGRVVAVADVTGKAPVGGAVARWNVEPGARVEAGQKVVQISSGAASAPALPGETRQIEAERQQTVAADDQMALSQKLSATQQRLAAAQTRVERAQTVIADTRALIARLRAGEVVTQDAPKTPSRTRANPQLTAARAKTRDAQAQSETAKKQLASARADLSAAQKSLTPLQTKVLEAQKNSRAIDEKFDKNNATSAADVMVARSAVSEAKSTLDSASKRVEGLLKGMADLESQVVLKESAADSARKIERGLQSDTPDKSTPVSASGGAVSLDQAAKRVADAVSESRSAAREADRLRSLVSQYQSQANSTNARIETATETLKTAPISPVAPVPRVRFTSAKAPASGVVMWIATLAREVGAGQSVFGLSSGRRHRARFEDRGDGWKNARAGQVVSALMAPPAPPVVAPTAISAPPSAATPAVAPPAPITAQNATPVSVKITRIAPPERAGEPAIIEGELAPGAGAQADANWRLLASLPTPGAPSILAVPASAIVTRGGNSWVATIADEPETAPTETATPAPDASATPALDDAISGRLQWQKVEVETSQGALQQVKSGLQAGQRVVTDPLPLLSVAPPESKALPLVKLSDL